MVKGGNYMKTTIVRGKSSKCWALKLNPKSDKILIPIKYKMIQDHGANKIISRLNAYYGNDFSITVLSDNDQMLTVENKKYRAPIFIGLKKMHNIASLQKDDAIETLKEIAANCERVHILTDKDGNVKNIIYTFMEKYMAAPNGKYELTISRYSIPVFDDKYPSADFLRVE